MLPTVRMVLELPIIQAAGPLLLGSGEGLGRLIRWVHVSEMKDMTGLLAGGELVLTTGLELEQDLAGTPSYLKAFEDAGVAGVIVELAGERTSAAAALASAASAVAMPVIILERRVRFVEITEIIHRIIVAEQLELVERSRDIHEVFTLLSMESAGTDQIVQRAAGLIGAPVVLEDLSHLVLAHSAAGMPTTDLLMDWERRSRTTPTPPLTARTGPENWLLTQVGLRQQMWGRLILPVHLDNDDVAAMVLERAGQALAIHRLADRDQRELSQQAQAGLLNTLRQPRGLSEAEALTRAAALGLKPAPLYVPVVFRVAGPAQRRDPLAGQQQERLLLDRLAGALKTTAGSALTASIQSGAVGMILAVTDKELEERTLQRIAGALRAPTGQPMLSWVIGVGRTRASLLEAAAGIDEAGHVAETAGTLRDSGKLYYRASDVRLRGLLALLRNDPRVQSFVEYELEGVLRAEAQGDATFLELLRLYLESGGNKTAIARDGFLSRPTLYSRLARLEDLLGVDIEDPESRTSLHVALILHQLREL